MERVGWIGVADWPVAPRVRFVKVRVKDDLCAMPNGPADRLRIPPAFMADHDAKGQWTGGEYATVGTGRIDRVLRRVELHFVLEARNCAVSIDYERRRHGRVTY